MEPICLKSCIEIYFHCLLSPKPEKTQNPKRGLKHYNVGFLYRGRYKGYYMGSIGVL